jgi:hypothetical protein
VFVWVSADAPEARLLEEAGLKLDPETAVHTGQGTASKFFSFENAYLELIWIADASTATADWRERAAWRDTGASPFGLGLRRVSDVDAPAPFATRRHSAPWMPRGAAIEIAVAAGDVMEPFVFIVPPAMAVRPLETLSADEREALVHPLGVRRVTGVGFGVHATGPHLPVVTTLAGLEVLDLIVGSLPALELTFDWSAHGQAVDLAPALPIRLRW